MMTRSQFDEIVELVSSILTEPGIPPKVVPVSKKAWTDGVCLDITPTLAICIFPMRGRDEPDPDDDPEGVPV
jgi:hypothetical protein